MRFLHTSLSILAFCCVILSIAADEVMLSDGSSVSGTIAEMQGGFLVLELADSHGLATRRIDPEKIVAINFSDSEDSRQQRALRRSRFIPLLSLNDAQVLIEYLNGQLTDGHALPALSYAKQWHPKNNYETLDVSYREILISASLASNAPDEALVHARNWLSLNPKPYSHPLPWEIVADHLLSENNPESALWVALQPIALQSTNFDSELANLKRIAADAYLALGYDQHAAALHDPENSLPQSSILELPSLENIALTFSEVLKTKIPQ